MCCKHCSIGSAFKISNRPTTLETLSRQLWECITKRKQENQDRRKSNKITSFSWCSLGSCLVFFLSSILVLFLSSFINSDLWISTHKVAKLPITSATAAWYSLFWQWCGGGGGFFAEIDIPFWHIFALCQNTFKVYQSIKRHQRKYPTVFPLPSTPPPFIFPSPHSPYPLNLFLHFPTPSYPLPLHPCDRAKIRYHFQW